ncbi:dynactin subunit 6-like isoform X2 [Harmonia axyridis]|nr:dynactin subunit 6-like isoform X2 [Harmonia axyridis]
MLMGDITFGNNCVVHPYVQILAVAGPIIIGDNCMLEERVQIIYRSPPGTASTKQKGPPLVIGSNNIFEVASRVEARRVGSNNTFETKSLIGPKVIVSDGCTIGAGCRISTEIVIGKNIVVYGEECTMRRALRQPSPRLNLLDAAQQILYKNHRILKTTHRHQSSN